MRLEMAIRLLAGTLILIGLILATWVNQWWLLLVLFVSLNLIQSSITNFCPAEIILKKLFYKATAV